MNPLKTTPSIFVCIGASSGGLKALKEFFTAMPGDSGLVFLVIMHLPSDRHSGLPEILSSSTPMKVLEVSDLCPTLRQGIGP